MTYEARKAFPVGPWDESPGLFLPEKVLDTCFKVVPSPSSDIMESIAFLAWVSTKEAKEYFTNAQRKLDDQKDEDLPRESWKRHSLYKESKGNLISKCFQAGSFGNKHDLVCRIVENTHTGVSPTSLTENNLYDGNLSSVPSSTAGLIKLSVVHLRVILRAHSVLEIGTKEELLAREGLLKEGYPEAAFSRERLCILRMIAVAKQIAEIQEDRLASSIHRIRAVAHGNSSTMTTRKACLKSVLTKETPTIQATIPRRKVDAVLNSLEKAVAQYDERARATVDDLEKTSIVKESKRK